MAVLGLCFCARAFSSCGKRGPLFIAVRGPLTVAASLVAEHRLQTRRLSNYGSRAQPLHGMWDLPRPGLEPMCPALAGRFSNHCATRGAQPHFKFLAYWSICGCFLKISCLSPLAFVHMTPVWNNPSQPLCQVNSCSGLSLDFTSSRKSFLNAQVWIRCYSYELSLYHLLT